MNQKPPRIARGFFVFYHCLYMFWADATLERFRKERIDALSAGKVVIRDEKTASGRVHVGSMRGAAIHGLLSEILKEEGVANTFLWEINDFDPMDGLPVYLDQETFAPHMGKPLYTVPSPDGKAKNYAEYFAEEFISVIEDTGFRPEYYRASELYLSGKMNEVIRIALENADEIRRIYKEVSGSERKEGWLPLSVICEQCGKVGTTRATSFDGEKVVYECGERFVEWAQGCGHKGVVSPFDGRAKLPWKVEWPAKFKVMGVVLEGGGKDHSTKGGAREVADRIAREVFMYKPPFNVPYEFFLVGGKKMSSSKGQGSSAREIADLVPPKIFRLALIGKDIRQAFDFEPEGDTIPVLFDTYDRLAEAYFSGVKDDKTRLFALIHGEKEREALSPRFLPRFSQVVFLVQMPHLSLENEVMKLKGSSLTPEDREELEERARYARHWLENYAPEQFRFVLRREGLPEEAKGFSDAQKDSLRKIRSYVEEHTRLDGQELHTFLHELRKSSGLEPEEFFGALYKSFLGKGHGPKVGWFLSVIDREFLLSRLGEASV